VSEIRCKDTLNDVPDAAADEVSLPYPLRLDRQGLSLQQAFCLSLSNGPNRLGSQQVCASECEACYTEQGMPLQDPLRVICLLCQQTRQEHPLLSLVLNPHLAMLPMTIHLERFYDSEKRGERIEHNMYEHIGRTYTTRRFVNFTIAIVQFFTKR
jgi:hypothetical protein